VRRVRSRKQVAFDTSRAKRYGQLSSKHCAVCVILIGNVDSFVHSAKGLDSIELFLSELTRLLVLLELQQLTLRLRGAFLLCRKLGLRGGQFLIKLL